MRIAGELPILAVLDGEVVHAEHEDVGDYGRTVVIKSKAEVRGVEKEVWHLYSHCSVILVAVGKDVFAGDTIGYVGWSGNAGRSNPHLHFEIATSRLPTKGGLAHETTPASKGIRIDPREFLRSLPPFETRVFVPKAEKPTELDATLVTDLHDLVETSPHGGYFPLGANNTWHGGVHLPFLGEERVFCPLEGQIVAARLDPDPATSLRQHGSTNFILVRHELRSRLYHQLRGTTAPSPEPSGGGGGGGGGAPTKPPKKAGVGGNYDNDPDLVERARQRLKAKGHYPTEVDPPTLEPGAVEPALIEALEAFQATLEPPKGYAPWPDGSMRYEGFTWDALFEGAPEEGPSHPDDDTDPDPPHEPAGEDDSLPARPPPPPQDPARVVYSLFMHLAAETFTDALAERFPWLQRAQLLEVPKVLPPGVDADLEAARKHREDLAEASSHRITKTVGRGDENPDDVQWVRKRLRRLDVLPEDDESGTYDDALRDAILVFQKTRVHPKRPSMAHGVISRGRKTDIALRRSRRQLGIDPPGPPTTIDPLVRALLCERGVDGMSRVLSGLRVPVAAGDPLWSPGEAGGFADDGGVDVGRRVHWGMFSEHPIFVDGHEDWASIVDPNEDLTVDAPRALIDLVADWPVGNPLEALPPDGIIDPNELAAFYGDAASDFLRRRQCQFRTEWGLDVGATVARLKDQGWAGSDGLGASLLPYQWWFDAVDVLPADTHVWHYNPIEFLGACHQALDALAPTPPKSREHYGSVLVRVVNVHGGPAVAVEVQLIDEEGTVHAAVTGAPLRNGSGGGVVDFPNVREGACTLVLTQSGDAHPLVHAHIRPGWDANTVSIATAFDGPDPVRGHVSVTVRRLGAIFKTPVELQLVDPTGRIVDVQTSKNAKARFEDVVVGDYVVRSVDGESEPALAVLDRARTVNVVVRRKAEPADLRVTVLHLGSPAPHVEVRVTDAKTGEVAVGGLGQTDDEGRCLFALRRGVHHVRVGKAKEHINLLPGHPNEALLEVDGALLPDEPYGVLRVRVVARNTDAQLPVAILHAERPEAPLHERLLDGQGEVVVRVPAGTYRVIYDRREAKGFVHAGTSNTLEL